MDTEGSWGNSAFLLFSNESYSALSLLTREEETNGERRAEPRTKKKTRGDSLQIRSDMAVKKELPQSWWFDGHNSVGQSPWLLSTLSELEERTKQMLKLIEEDADSFAQRAEMYYKKRPQLVNMIEDFYRAHRSLAEQYDLLKSGGGKHRSTSSGRSSVDKSCPQKVTNGTMDESSVFSSDFFDSEDSEIEDPEQEEAEDEKKLREVPDKKSDNDVVIKQMSIELERLKQENATLKAELAEKDEEKREVIRQLALPVDILKEENTMLRKCIKEPKKSVSHFEFKKLTKEIFSGRLFAGLSKRQTTIVAL